MKKINKLMFGLISANVVLPIISFSSCSNTSTELTIDNICFVTVESTNGCIKFQLHVNDWTADWKNKTDFVYSSSSPDLQIWRDDEKNTLNVNLFIFGQPHLNNYDFTQTIELTFTDITTQAKKQYNYYIYINFQNDIATEWKLTRKN